ncbi:MAG TPA: hypothetical protein VFB20_15670 [Burkholderiales bacterium]|nr:hypothetical protein [Burkholderiales bacterium]
MEEKPEACEFCRWPTAELTYYDAGDGGWLCHICASTPTGNMVLFPQIYSKHNTDVLRTMVLIGHMLLEAIRGQADTAERGG